MLEPGTIFKKLDIRGFIVNKSMTKTLIYKIFTDELYDARCIVRKRKNKSSLRDASFIMTNPKAERTFLHIPNYYFGECDISLRVLYNPKRFNNEGCILPYVRYEKQTRQRRMRLCSEYLKDHPYLTVDDPLLILKDVDETIYLQILLRKADSEAIKRPDNLMGTILFYTDVTAYEQNLNALEEIYGKKYVIHDS